MFAIGDVHGCADELRSLLEKLQLTAEATVVFLGDYIDRGAQSREVIDTVLELRERCNVVSLMGNHEAMFLDYLEDPHSARAGAFIYNGGSATLASYADLHGEFVVPDEHLAFLRSLALFHETEQHFFVHAGLPQIPIEQLDVVRDRPTMLWTRGEFLTTKYRWEKVIVHGHSRVPRITLWPNRINLDTGCVFNGRLTAIALPDEAVFSVKRRHVTHRIVLRDTTGTRNARRFVGAIPVNVLHDGRILEFVTVDYSELGMYLRALSSDENDRFDEGDVIKGVVAPDDLSPVRFVGVIVRSRIDDRGVHYGVKLIDDDG